MNIISTIKAEAPALTLIVAATILPIPAAIALSTLYVGFQYLSSPTKIYSLQKRGDLAPYAEKVEQLRGKSDLLGLAFLPQGKVIYVAKKISTLCEEYIAYDLTTRLPVGSAVAETTLSLYNGHIEQLTELARLDNFARGTHKNVGSVLIKAILQDTWKQNEGRMEVISTRNAYPFYKKLGFRSIYGNNSRMHLTAGARALWREEIEQNPIIF